MPKAQSKTQTIKELKKILREHPTTWTLRGDTPDDATLPEHPVLRIKPPQAKRQKTKPEAIRAVVRKYAASDPTQLWRAVQRHLLTRSEADQILRRTWGAGVSLDDFAPRKVPK